MNLRRALAAVLSIALLCQLCRSTKAARRGSGPLQLKRSAKPVSTLVIYIFAQVKSRLGSSELCFQNWADAQLPASTSQVDGQSRPNLVYFLQHGVSAADGAHYVVVVQTDDTDLV